MAWSCDLSLHCRGWCAAADVRLSVCRRSQPALPSRPTHQHCCSCCCRDYQHHHPRHLCREEQSHCLHHPHAVDPFDPHPSCQAATQAVMATKTKLEMWAWMSAGGAAMERAMTRTRWSRGWSRLLQGMSVRLAWKLAELVAAAPFGVRCRCSHQRACLSDGCSSRCLWLCFCLSFCFCACVCRCPRCPLARAVSQPSCSLCPHSPCRPQ